MSPPPQIGFWRLGLVAVLASAAYLVSDAVEAVQGGFSDPQLSLTLIAEAAIPPLVIGLYLAQRPRIGRLGQLSALAYAYAFVFFTGTVVYALVDRTSDYETLTHRLSPWMTIHGAIMVVAGLGFGYAVVKAKVFPRWTGIALGLGVVFVAGSQNMPEGFQLAAAAVRDLGFLGMGAALMRMSRPAPGEAATRRRIPAVGTSGSGARHSATARADEAALYLFWLPLGAGGHCVRLNGRAFEAISARVQRRPACDLYHSALEVRLGGLRYVIEQTPVPDRCGDQRGVVAEGAVGSRWASPFRIFRYEIRCWRDGAIPDVDEAVGIPLRVSQDVDRVRRVLDLICEIPTPVWGRDELKTGEMWNSNSVVSWVLACSGIDAGSIEPPEGGRAPGWRAGLVVAARHPEERPSAPLGRARVHGGPLVPGPTAKQA